MFRLLLFLSNNADINSIISSVVLSDCINILSMSLFNALCKNSVKAYLDISAFRTRYMFSAANAWNETNPRASELLNLSKS